MLRDLKKKIDDIQEQMSNINRETDTLKTNQK